MRLSRASIATSSGTYFDFFTPEQSDINIIDIAHALSNICRFTGHCEQFYSVAQHSVLVSYVVDPPYALQGLLHDAAEAYIGDVAKPLKNLLYSYQAIEKRVEKAVLNTFGIKELHPSVKTADKIVLATEKRDLTAASTHHWEELDGYDPLPEGIKPVDPRTARRMFMQRYLQVRGLPYEN